METEFQFKKVKNSGDSWCWKLHNNVNVFSVPTVQLNMVKIVCFILCEVHHNSFFLNQKTNKQKKPRGIESNVFLKLSGESVTK